MASKESQSFYVQKRHFLVDIRGQLEALVKWEQDADVPDEGDLKHYGKMLRDVEDDLDALEPMIA